MKPFLKSKKSAVNDRVLKIFIEQKIKSLDFLKDEVISKKEIYEVLSGQGALDKNDIYYLSKKYHFNPYYLYHGKGLKKVEEGYEFSPLRILVELKKIIK